MPPLRSLVLVAALLGAIPEVSDGAQRLVAVREVALGKQAAPIAQFFGSDREGRLERLSGDLVLSRLKASGLEPSGRLETLPGALEVSPLRASRSRDGDWLLLSADKPPLRWFRDGKEIPIPDPGRWVRSIGFLGSSPMIAVAPVQLGRSALDDGTWSEPPLVLVLDGQEWKGLYFDERKPQEILALLREKQGCAICADSEVLLAVEPEGSNFWLVSTSYYGARRLSSGGTVQLLATRGDQTVRFRERSSTELAALKGPGEGAPAEQTAAFERMRQKKVTVPVVLAAAASKGVLYLLTRGEDDSYVLDRIDASGGEAERARLSFVGYPGALTMLATRDGLLIVPFQATAGAWRIAWEELEGAAWEPVSGIEIRKPH